MLDYPANTTQHDADEITGLVQRAAVQIGSLRRTLEEATECDRLVRERIADLSRRLEQGERFNAEMDNRLKTATGSVAILEKTAAGLRSLETLLARVHKAKEEWEREWAARIEQERAAFETRLTEHARTMTERLESQITSFDSVCAALDRKAAAIQARASVALDQAEERLATMERRAADLGTDKLGRFEVVFGKAASLLGDTEQPGLLAAAVADARSAVTDCNDAAVRINALVERADEAGKQVVATTETAGNQVALIERCMNQAAEQAEALVTIVRDVIPIIEHAEHQHHLRAA